MTEGPSAERVRMLTTDCGTCSGVVQCGSVYPTGDVMTLLF